MATPASWSSYAYDSSTNKYGIGFGIIGSYILSEDLKIIARGGYDLINGNFTSVTTGLNASLSANYIHAMAGVGYELGSVLPVPSRVELTGGVILVPTLGSTGIPSRGDPFSAIQSPTWCAAIRYVVEMNLNHYLDAHVGLGYFFIPPIMAQLPSVAGGGSTQSVSVSLGNIRADVGIAFNL